MYQNDRLCQIITFSHEFFFFFWIQTKCQNSEKVIQTNLGGLFFCPKITTFLKIKLLVSKTFCQTKCPISDKLSDRFSFGFRQLIALPALYPNVVSGAVNGYKMTLIVNHSDFRGCAAWIFCSLCRDSFPDWTSILFWCPKPNSTVSRDHKEVKDFSLGGRNTRWEAWTLDSALLNSQYWP